MTVKRSHHIFFQYTSLLSQLAFIPLLWPQMAPSHSVAGGGTAAATCGPGRGQKKFSSGTRFQNNCLKSGHKKITRFLMVERLWHFVTHDRSFRFCDILWHATPRAGNVGTDLGKPGSNSKSTLRSNEGSIDLTLSPSAQQIRYMFNIETQIDSELSRDSQKWLASLTSFCIVVCASATLLPQFVT